MGSAVVEKQASRFAIGGNNIYFVSLGCPRNLVDSEVMLGLLVREGYEVCQTLEDADFIVVNTCGFLGAARQESLDTVGEILADRKPSAKVIVTGCMVQIKDSTIKEQYPEVDYFLGSGDVEGIINAVKSSEQGAEVTDARSYLEAGETPRLVSTPPHYAYLKIAEGCRKRCSFCIIPEIKGPLRSKTQEQVLKEFRALLSRGVHEVILIAQDLGDFGKDRREKGALAELLREMCKIDEPFWLRLLYLYPDEIDDELIAVMKSDPRICPYLDMPIQHINDDILKAMRRKTCRKDIEETITKLRKEIPDISIRTSLMVGFPGETEEQYQELEQFVRDFPLDNIGVFQFSKEETAHAAELPNHISEDVKEERFHRLMQVQRDVVIERNKRFIGQTIPVIVDGYHPDTDLLMVGRHRGQCPEVDAWVILNDHANVQAFGEVVSVEITDAAEYDLIGRVQ